MSVLLFKNKEKDFNSLIGYHMYGTLCEENVNGKNEFFTFSDSEMSVVYLSHRKVSSIA